ncbi:hypothetical protein V3Q77_08340 [Flavobacterium davisii]|uniref:Uncharacterized protein n=1 Tax=Flavobacterium davisii TaxID=2906077 RepID=A0ABW8PQK8_9FLAO
MTPFLFYLYKCFPDAKQWETFFFTYNSNFYENVRSFAWVFLQKFIWLTLMVIWFFTNSKWWNKALLPVIGMLVYQLIILISDDIKRKDEPEIESYMVVPIAVVVCIGLFLIHRKLKPLAMALDLKDAIDKEIEKTMEELNNPNT